MIIATAMRKLIHIIYGILKSEKPLSIELCYTIGQFKIIDDSKEGITLLEVGEDVKRSSAASANAPIISTIYIIKINYIAKYKSLSN